MYVISEQRSDFVGSDIPIRLFGLFVMALFPTRLESYEHRCEDVKPHSICRPVRTVMFAC